MKEKYRVDYDFEIISFMEQSGQIDPDEAKFMRNFVRSQAY